MGGERNLGVAFYHNYLPKDVCVGLRWTELTFDLCDCISCSGEALQTPISAQPAVSELLIDGIASGHTANYYTI